MFCNKCGAKLEENAQFCSMCGSVIEKTDIEKIDDEPVKEQTASKNKIIMAILSILLLVSVVLNIVQICISSKSQVEDKDGGAVVEKVKRNEMIENAIESLSDEWTEIYAKDGKINGYLEIYHTRVVDITPDETDTLFQELDRGMEIDYIIEFSLYSDYFSAEPYYHNAAVYDTVLVYEDGTTSVASNFFRTYSNLTYSYDYSGFVEEIEDMGTSYNRVIDLK